jgi:putative ABC transport system permease protein
MSSIAASVYGVLATVVAPRFNVGLALISLGLGVGASLLGAWFPARASSNLDPIQALHNIESRQRELSLGWKRIALGLILLLACSALIQFSPSGVGMTIQLSYAVFILLGLTILLPSLMQGAAHLIRPVMDWAGGPEGALAADAMIKSPRRSSATVGALMAGLMFVFSTGAYIQSYKHMIDRWTDRVLNADLFVATSALLRSTSYHFSEDLGRKIARCPRSIACRMFASHLSRFREIRPR